MILPVVEWLHVTLWYAVCEVCGLKIFFFFLGMNGVPFLLDECPTFTVSVEWYRIRGSIVSRVCLPFSFTPSFVVCVFSRLWNRELYSLFVCVIVDYVYVVIPFSLAIAFRHKWRSLVA